MDKVLIAAVLVLAGCLFFQEPVHSTYSLGRAPSLAAQPVPRFVTGKGPNLAWPVRDLEKWRHDNVTTVPHSGNAPDTENAAYRLAETQDQGLHRIETSINGAVGGKLNVLSVFVKPQERTALRFEMRDVMPGKYGLAVFDLAKKVVRGALGDVNDAGIQELPGGWYRCWAAMPFASGATVVNFALLNADREGTYAGDGHSGLLIWGVQFEPGDHRPRGYFAGEARADK